MASSVPAEAAPIGGNRVRVVRRPPYAATSPSAESGAWAPRGGHRRRQRRRDYGCQSSARPEAAGLEPDYRDALASNSSPGVVSFLLNKLPEGDRSPGPLALHEVSTSARRRWKEDPANLPEGCAYRPATLKAVASLLDAF